MSGRKNLPLIEHETWIGSELELGQSVHRVHIKGYTLRTALTFFEAEDATAAGEGAAEEGAATVEAAVGRTAAEEEAAPEEVAAEEAACLGSEHMVLRILLAKSVTPSCIH